MSYIVGESGHVQAHNDAVNDITDLTTELEAKADSTGGVITGILQVGAGVTLNPVGTVTIAGTTSVQIAVNPLATTDQVLAVRILSEGAQRRFNLYADGKLEWGPGGATALDTNLYRAAPNVLRTDDALQVGTGIECTGSIAVAEDNTSKLLFGSAFDTNLYRSAADMLKTDDTLMVGGNFACNGATPAAKPVITGSRGGNAALASLLTALAAIGILTDSSTA